jgi:uncharacterized membrane protein YgcG
MRRFVIVALFIAATTPLIARDLHWQLIEVKARLDDKGTLHVVERQRFVFNGDWNGGERRFRVADGQTFTFKGISRIDEAGNAIPLKTGNLAQLNCYGFLQGNVLRWRSRLPTDPEFDNTVLTYDIAYELSSILIAFGHGSNRKYVLNHDFAFPERSGIIERFTLDLELDPVWHGPDPNPIHIARRNLLPGESVTLRRELTYSGAQTPDVTYTAASPVARYLTIALVILGMPFIFIRFLLGERARGRFVRPNETIDAAWIEEHIVSELPEVVGYMYDHKSGPPEVAAILARLTQTGDITTTVVRRRFRAPLLRMTRNKTGRELLTQERQLLNMFFIGRSDEIDTDRIREHYKTTGFDPGGQIESSLHAQAARNFAWKDDAPRAKKLKQQRTIGIAFATLVAGTLFGWSSFWLMLWLAALGGIACAAGRAIATRSADKTRWLPLWWLTASAPTLIVAWLLVLTALLFDETRIKEIPFLIAAGFVLTVYWYVMKGAPTRQSTEKMLLRARIAAVRRWFTRQLRARNPHLRDEWSPWLLALGLGRNVDRWFSAFGAELATGTAMDSSFGTSSVSSSPTTSHSSQSASTSTWSGGGGSFGGAGSTGSWAAAATSLASGSSAPSESSSGSGSDAGGSSGGDSGGSSSGGGGGGGW